MQHRDLRTGTASVWFFLALALALGTLVGWKPALLVLPVAAVCLYGLTVPWFRFVWFIGGAMLVFQASGDGLNAPKVLYLAGVLISAAFAAHGLISVAGVKPVYIRRVTAGAVALLIVFGMSAIYSIGVQGISPLDWSRDALTYLLIVAGVIIACDVSRSVTQRFAVSVTTVLGLVAAFGFAIAWIGRRDLSGGVDQILLSSMSVLVPPLALFLTRALSGPRVRLIWLLAALFVVTAVLVSGTRTGLVLPLVVIGLIGANARCRVPWHRAVVSLVGLGIMGYLVVPLVGSLVVRQGYVEDRFATTLSVLSEGVASDQSGQLRQAAYSAARAIFEENVLLGQGVGAVFPSLGRKIADSGYTLDTPWVVPAKFGVLGAILVVGFIVYILVALVRPSSEFSRLPMNTVAGGALFGWLLLLPFGPVIEDKGFALGLACLVLLVTSKTTKVDPGAGAEGGSLAGETHVLTTSSVTSAAATPLA